MGIMNANKMYFNLHIWHIGTFFLTSGFLLEKDFLTKYIKNYEIVDCYISTSRNRRNSQIKDGEMKDSFDTEVRFKSHETGFRLLLFEDKAFHNLSVQSYTPDNFTKSEEVNITLYEGIMSNNTMSYAAGYMQNHVFVGIVKFNETLYFVEPASRYFLHSKSNKIVVYKDEDVELNNIAPQIENKSTIFWYKMRINPGFDSVVSVLKGINKTDNPNEDYACKIELVSDHTLYDFFDRNVNLLTAYLYLHVRFSDLIFRETDFDGDGKRDRIRIIPEKIFIYKTVDGLDFPTHKIHTIKEFLTYFSFRTQTFCLSVCVMYKSSPDFVLGVAYTSPKLSNTRHAGGICQKPVSINTGMNTYKNVSLNTLVLYVRSDIGIPLPLPISCLAFAHELGHSFGSSHDRLDDLHCTPGGPKGFYLMHFRSQSGLKSINRLFSPCSKKTIAAIISTRGECLKPHPATCGNGIQEGNEECDCGNKASCFYINPCCSPSDARHPEKGCTIRRRVGFVCSAKENKCCLNDCRINKDPKFMCYNDDAECLLSYCDGKRATCPEPKVAPDRYPCKSYTKTCLKGRCNSSVCLDNGLGDCTCKYPFECYVCCREAVRCIPAPSFRFVSTAGAKYFALEGTPCNDGKYQCNGSGECINPLNRQLDMELRSEIQAYWVVGGSVVAFFAAITVLAYSVERFFLLRMK